MLIPLVPFLRKAYYQPAVRTQIVNTLKSWVSQESLVLIYPTFFYVFTTLPTNAKTPFAMLLPIMKILMRNVMSRTVVHLSDEIPEIVLMNVEVFNSLFMSYCMQNSPSIWTTLGLILVDGTQMIASMHDVEKVIKRMQIVKEQVTTERARRIMENPTIDQIQELRRKTILGYAQDILERHSPTQTTQVVVASPRTTGLSPTTVLPLDATTKTMPVHKELGSSSSSRSKLMGSFSMGKNVFPSSLATSPVESFRMGFWNGIARLTDFWEAAQVELHGFYSVKRVRDYVDYSRRTSVFRAFFVAAVMPWPCVIITILVDLIPLRSPAEGLHANYEFVVRVFLSFLVASVAVNLQFRHSMPSAPLSNQRVVVTSAITAAQTTGVLFGLSRAVGFPLPFGIITVSPAWVAFLLIPLASFLRKARADPEQWPLVLNSLKVWVCQETLVVIYPTYFYIFTTMPQNAKTPFAMLLPIIKMVLRNIMSRTVVHLNDEIPEVVLMKVEVFNSLFMSYCMQNTPSLWTTLGLYCH
ncbi:hypothetical protein PF007_g23808 [Phytophthora fragariae]|uniref:Uncharacterized protein n=3 Tax=Phytophthora fragariae TaxID=53985 RepID=A0A6A3QMA0_9STRA|nr:hypothetical protein PF007_g23808 [Phytophthora fragariae]